MTQSGLVPRYDFFTKATGHLVPSPCVSICNINAETQLCEGCFRTLDEIGAWSQMDNAAKREVWVQISKRASSSKPLQT